jgi:hypothetical protein
MASGSLADALEEAMQTSAAPNGVSRDDLEGFDGGKAQDQLHFTKDCVATLASFEYRLGQNLLLLPS